MTDFRFSDDGMGFIFQDVLASLSTYTIGNSGSICFRNQAEKDAFMKAVIEGISELSELTSHLDSCRCDGCLLAERMLLDEEQAVESGDANTPWSDYETEPKMDERNTEAWLEF